MSAEYFLFGLLGGALVAGSYGAAAALHEGGHMLFGRLAGGSCLWIRLGRFLWVPGGGVFVRGKGKVFTGESIIACGKKALNGAGECVLSCPDRKSLLWAALGGPAANLLGAFFAGAGWVFCGEPGKEIYSLKGMVFLLFLLCSLLMAFLSLFFRWGGELNDGLMVWKLYRSEEFCRKLRKNQQKDLLRLEFGLAEEMF